MKTAGLKGFKIVKMLGVHLSHKQKLFDTFCLIGILIMVYLSPHIAGHIIPYIPLNKKKVFVHCFPGNVPLLQGMFFVRQTEGGKSDPMVFKDPISMVVSGSLNRW